MNEQLTTQQSEQLEIDALRPFIVKQYDKTTFYHIPNDVIIMPKIKMLKRAFYSFDMEIHPNLPYYIIKTVSL